MPQSASLQSFPSAEIARSWLRVQRYKYLLKNQRHQDHRRRSLASHPPTPSFISYHSLKGLSTSQVQTSPFEILRRVSKIQRHFSGKSKSSLLSGGGASGAFARRKTDCDLGCDLWWMRRPFSNAESVRSNACFMQPACSETYTPPPLSSRAQATTIRVPPAHT